MISDHKLNLFLRRFHVLYVEMLGYKINLFNTNTNGALVLKSERVKKMAGAIESNDFFKRPLDLLDRRNPNGMRPLDLVNLDTKLANKIRLAWTTKLLNMSRYQWDWIGQDPSAAATVFAEGMTDSILEAYLLRTFGVLRATVGSNPATFYDAFSSTVENRRRMSYANLELTADKFGDAMSQIKTWIMPTTAKTQLLLGNLKNAEQLFTFGTVGVSRDASGRSIITTDDPNLRQTVSTSGGVENAWWAFGLVPNAVVIEELDDWDDIAGATTGYENIMRTYQANWSNSLAVKGYKFDESLLLQADIEGRDPYVSASDGAILTRENWSQVETSHKGTAGVALRVDGNLHDFQQ